MHFFTFDPVLEVENDDRRRKLRQTNIKESLDKDAIARVSQDIVRFWYQVDITFNAAKLCCDFRGGRLYNRIDWGGVADTNHRIY